MVFGEGVVLVDGVEGAGGEPPELLSMPEAAGVGGAGGEPPELLPMPEAATTAAPAAPAGPPEFPRARPSPSSVGIPFGTPMLKRLDEPVTV